MVQLVLEIGDELSVVNCSSSSSEIPAYPGNQLPLVFDSFSVMEEVIATTTHAFQSDSYTVKPILGSWW